MKTQGNYEMEITYFLPSQDSTSKTAAEFGLKIPELDMTFSRVKLIRGKNNNLFIASPCYKIGEQYNPYWSIGDSKRKAFNDLAMKALKDYYQIHYSQSLESLAVSSSEELPF